jgi:hypothetical protein
VLRQTGFTPIGDVVLAGELGVRHELDLAWLLQLVLSLCPDDFPQRRSTARRSRWAVVGGVCLVRRRVRLARR